jgi:hypothetical protein
MAHAEDLAQEGVVAELCVQHSDRLARGDGHSARHTVEIALWALKREVKICTLHDPDTFRNQHRRPEDACSASAARPSTVRVAGLSAEHGGLVEKQA